MLEFEKNVARVEFLQCAEAREPRARLRPPNPVCVPAHKRPRQESAKCGRAIDVLKQSASAQHLELSHTVHAMRETVLALVTRIVKAAIECTESE